MRNEISKKVTNAQLAKKFRDLCFSGLKKSGLGFTYCILLGEKVNGFLGKGSMQKGRSKHLQAMQKSGACILVA